MAAQTMELLGNGAGQYSDKADPSADQVVPRIYGRVWVKPRLLFARSKSTSWSVAAPTASTMPFTSGQSVDAILALGQAGLTIRAVRISGALAGRYEVIGYQGSPAWVKVTETPDPYYALLCALAGVNVNASWLSGGAPGQNNAIYRYSVAFAPMEVLNAANAPWGKRTAGAASIDVNYVTSGHVPQPAWTDITGTTMPAWAHLNATDAAGLTYSQLTTIRCEGIPLIGGVLPEIEVQVDGNIGGVAGPDCSAVDAIRDILVNLMRIPSAKVITDVGPDGSTASSYRAWCAAMATTIGINAIAAAGPEELLPDILTATCSELVPLANGAVRVQPLGDTVVGGFSPATAAYVVDSTDIAGDVVECEERPQAECPNAVWSSYTDPSTPDTSIRVPWRDDFDIAKTQLRKGDTFSSRFISSALHAKFVAEWKGKRGLRNRRTWPDLKLTSRFLLLEQGDLLELRDPRLPVSVVRVTKRDIDLVGGKVIVECEEWNGGCHPVDITPDLPAGLVETTPSAAELVVPANAAVAAQRVADIYDDNVLTPAEKPPLIKEWGALYGEQAGIIAQATAAGVDYSAYANAVYLLGMGLASDWTTPVTYDNLTGNTNINGAALRTRITNVYTTKQALLNAIANQPTVSGVRVADTGRVVSCASVLRDDRGYIIASGIGISGATRFDRGTSATPRYVVRLSLPVDPAGPMLVAPGRPDVPSPTFLLPVVIMASTGAGHIDVGLINPATGAYQDPDAVYFQFFMSKVVTWA